MQISRFVRLSLLAFLIVGIPALSFSGVLISVAIAPPALPVYVQPACPGDGYIWTPGYWAYGPDGYYWVPGTWVLAPEPGFLWTPGYWGWGGAAYIWHPGYWGPHVGFYGGINYGFGYFGAGYAGGYWRGREFYYNRSVNNVNITNVHIYNKTVVNNYTVNRVSYNGGRGGINRRPNGDEMRWERDRHMEATGPQMQHEHAARENREFLASSNHGRPPVAAVSRPGDFHGHDAVPARGGREVRPEQGRMNRDVPRPQGSARMDRPASRQDNMDRGRGRNESPRPDARVENRGNAGPRSDARMDNRGNGGPRPDSRMETRGNAGQHQGGRPEARPPQHEQAPRGNGGQHEANPRGNGGQHEGGPHGGGGHERR